MSGSNTEREGAMITETNVRLSDIWEFPVRNVQIYQVGSALPVILLASYLARKGPLTRTRWVSD